MEEIAGKPRAARDLPRSGQEVSKRYLCFFFFTENPRCPCRNHNKTAMVDIETGRSFTFAAFNKECNRYANYFQVCGLWPSAPLLSRQSAPFSGSRIPCRRCGGAFYGKLRGFCRRLDGIGEDWGSDGVDQLQPQTRTSCALYPDKPRQGHHHHSATSTRFVFVVRGSKWCTAHAASPAVLHLMGKKILHARKVHWWRSLLRH